MQLVIHLARYTPKTTYKSPLRLCKQRADSIKFIVEEQSEAGQVSQPLRASEPGVGDLSKLTAPTYFLGVKLMFVVVMNFSQIKKNMVCRCEHFSATFFGHLDSFKLTNLYFDDIT